MASVQTCLYSLPAEAETGKEPWGCPSKPGPLEDRALPPLAPVDSRRHFRER